MRLFRAALVALCALVPVVASAQISGISPQELRLGDIESYLTIRGENLMGSESTLVTYSGRAGKFTLEPSTLTANVIEVWIPIPVASNEGQYAVEVIATDIGGAVRQYGPVTLSVINEVQPGVPLLAMPEVQVAEATGRDGAVVAFNVSATSQGGTGLTLTCDHPSGSLFPLGTTFVTCTATDSVGSNSGSFLLVVTDTTRPVLTLPDDIATTSSVVTFTATATDNLDGDVPVHCSPASGSTFPTGITIVQCFAEDEHLNVTFGSFQVDVNDGLPKLTLPGVIYAEATSPAGAAVTYTVTATNGGTVQCTPASGSTFPIGSTTVQCTATNAAGSTQGSFTVNVFDTTPPQFVQVKATPDALWPPDHKMVAVTIQPVVYDAGDANPVVQIVSVTSNQPVEGTGDGDTAPDWQITGALTVNLRNERSGNADRVYTITLRATDATGNSSETTIDVKVTQSSKGRAAGR
jgi:hypothetical protein